MSSACRSAASAAAWVSVERWYGNRTNSKASITAGAAARYPSRPPANANAFDIVRTTTSLRAGTRSINPIALGRSENSAYASSTTTMPGAAGQHEPDVVQRKRSAGRIVRAGEEQHIRCALGDQRGRGVDVDR